MFMFRSRRTNLTKRLLKAKKKRGGNVATTVEDDAEIDDVMVLLKKLQENQLGMLWAAVESRGRNVSNCVLLPSEHQPHVLCCRAWRWPDLLQGAELRRLPVCRSANDPVYLCCNPYHWSRIYQPETPSPPSPPPYSRYTMEKLRPEDRAPSEDPESLTTSGDDSYRNPLEWCKLAYWELAQRVGPLFTVDTPAVNILGDVPYGDGLSLQTLAQHNFNPPESVLHTRCKIGLGVTLSLEGDSVWLYNRSDGPVFVNSLTLDGVADWRLPARVPAEQCLCVYDPAKAARRYENWEIGNRYGPVNPNSVRISFAKGWGPRYRRQDITSCPCWVEILLAPCR